MESEILSKVLDKNFIRYEDLQSLSYTDRAINETLRKWPPIPSINRISAAKKLINGFSIPKETEITVCLSVFHKILELKLSNNRLLNSFLSFLPDEFFSMIH